MTESKISDTQKTDKPKSGERSGNGDGVKDTSAGIEEAESNQATILGFAPAQGAAATLMTAASAANRLFEAAAKQQQQQFATAEASTTKCVSALLKLRREGLTSLENLIKEV
ncbi:RebB family R body protein [uncultured Roseibium sp.]|uniref:RebB family R body protein n=1 Tax=uncultured Roseibium sp. TaxID=1936171 RepID=UPI002630F096|nr:RebB family R body protein [uncultured Roseibium sp.]